MHKAMPAGDSDRVRTVRGFQNVLINALKLAESGESEAARRIIYWLIRDYPDDYRVWWALANVTNQMDEAQMALNEALRRKPDQTEARELLERLEQRS